MRGRIDEYDILDPTTHSTRADSPTRPACLAVETCTQQKVAPEEALSTQFLLTPTPAAPLEGLKALQLETFVLHYGRAVEMMRMVDGKGRLFGVFLGIGVDPDGALITPESFQQFDSQAEGFVAAIEHYIAYTAGRYMVVLDCPAARRILVDPVAHLSTLYDPRTRRVGSSVQMVLDRPIEPDPLFQTAEIPAGTLEGEAEPGYILGHSQDASVKFCLPNHSLCLESFRPARTWPQADSFPPCPPEEYDALVAAMVARLRAVLGALVTGRPSIMPVSGGTDSRKLLACVTDRLDDLREFFAFEHTEYARLDADTGEYVVSALLNQPFRRYPRQPSAAIAAMNDFQRRQRKRIFWLRTSSVAPPPNEHVLGMTEQTPSGHLHLRGNVMDLMRGVWWGSFAKRHDKAELGLDEEIGALFMLGDPSKRIIVKWAEEYLQWKQGLPPEARALVFDFIFLELFLHVSSAKYYGYENNFYICPFSDRSLIEMTLRFPVEMRFAGTLNEMFLQKADPRLADQPYRGGVRKLMKRGKWQPAGSDAGA